MDCYKNNRGKQIYKLLSLIRLSSLLLCGIIILTHYHWLVGYDDVKIITGFSTTILGIVCCMLFLIFKAWMISLKSDENKINIKLKSIIEIVLFILVFSILIILTGGYTSPYKIIFFLVIVTSTIQFGKKYGIVVSAICALIVLAIDIVTASAEKLNHYFQVDLIIAGIFILSAWLMGYYVQTEKEHRKELSELVNIDGLTGVFNHRYFHEAIAAQLEAAESSTTISLLFIDIDYFKRYNDLYGHLQGDEVLNKVASLIKKNVRSGDVVARYGGEEFAVILSNTHEKDAILIGERIRSAIYTTHFDGEENLPKNKLTVSIGVSCFPNKAKSQRDLIMTADDAMYKAKFLDRNRVEVYSSVLEELKQDVDDKHIDLISSIKTLISVVNATDQYTYGHIERVVMYCDLVAQKLELSEEDRKTLKVGAYLHDIGKIEIPKNILNKKEKLTDEEWNYIKKHPENGVNIIKKVPNLYNAIPLILHHHERYDGKGYPSNLKGEDIPYLVRILSVADSFDAMTSSRPYGTPKSYDQAIEELNRCKGTQFDSNIVDVFIDIIKQLNHEVS